MGARALSSSVSTSRETFGDNGADEGADEGVDVDAKETDGAQSKVRDEGIAEGKVFGATLTGSGA